MKAIFPGLGLLVLCAVQATPAADTPAAADSRPTEASVRELFRTMNTRSVIDAARAQIDSSSNATLGQALPGQQLNERQRQIVREGHQQIVALLGETLDWNTLEPGMVEVYRDHFTQHEIDQMLQFYRSPTGQMVIAKLPATTQDMMQRMQARMRSLAPRIAELQKDIAAKVRSAADEPTAPEQPAIPA
ncbi:MAG: DUF2059 domain-containing protein, partial [Gammaproteobacteria bacterium]|nr:DUF2059 domain-containing protein [Gammaproteobacteria bacterium]